MDTLHFSDPENIEDESLDMYVEPADVQDIVAFVCIRYVDNYNKDESERVFGLQPNDLERLRDWCNERLALLEEQS